MASVRYFLLFVYSLLYSSSEGLIPVDLSLDTPSSSLMLFLDSYDTLPALFEREQLKTSNHESPWRTGGLGVPAPELL